MIENNAYGLIILGKLHNDDYSKEIRDLIGDDDRIVLIDFIEPPNHLQLTANCDVGVILYAPINLNNIYCAPNKIFEYASYGLSQLLPFYPGIENLNRQYNLGSTCDPEDPASIKDALVKLLERDKEISKISSQNFLTEFPSLEQSYKEVIDKINEFNI
jgi:glycosyltransferase involved in cell wall biosynthesis